MEQEPRGNGPERFELLREVADLLGAFGVAAAQMVGRDIKGLFSRGKPESYGPYTPMTDDEVRRWNNENGFPRDWRN